MRLKTLLLLCPFLFASNVSFGQTEKVLDKIDAVVGNEIITSSELQLQLLRIGMRQKIDMSDPSVRRRVLDEMLNRKLILAQAVLDSVNVPEEQVTAQLDQQIKMFEQNYGSIQKLEQAAGMTIAQMKREYREDIRKNLMVESLQRDKFGSITVSNREVQEFFQTYKDSLPQVPEQVELRQIALFPRVMESFHDAAKKRAKDLLDSIKSGVDFSELAKKYSDDVGSAKNGGDLGLARRGVFVKAFEEAAFGLQEGQVSDVIETQFGFHLIKVNERKGEAVRAQHILIRVTKTGESDSTVIIKLQEIRKRILVGEDFATLAKEYSEDEATKNYGGDLGLIEVQQLSAEMQTIQQNLRTNDICEPAKVSLDKEYAYSIVQLVKRVHPHSATLANDYQRIAGYARVFKQNKLYNDWLEEIKNNVYWKVFL